MQINNYFSTPVWSEEKPEFVKSLNKASDKYIKEAKKRPEVKIDHERITIAFDLRLKDSYEKDIYPHRKHHWKKI